MGKEADVKGDPIKLTEDLREFNDLNRTYKWLELHHQNIQMKWHEGAPSLSPRKYKFGDTLQVKHQEEGDVSRDRLKALKQDLIEA